jgi:hypothetical protein
MGLHRAYITHTASQDMGLHRCIEISHSTDYEAVWNLFYINTNIESSSLLMRFQFALRPVSFGLMVLQVSAVEA